MVEILLIGLGAIGTHLAALLSLSHRPSILVRQPSLISSLKTNGFKLKFVHSPELNEHIKPHQFQVLSPLDLKNREKPFDIILFVVKSTSLSSIYPSISHIISPSTLLIFAQNGIPFFYFSTLHNPPLSPSSSLSSSNPSHSDTYSLNEINLSAGEGFHSLTKQGTTSSGRLIACVIQSSSAIIYEPINNNNKGLISKDINIYTVEVESKRSLFTFGFAQTDPSLTKDYTQKLLFFIHLINKDNVKSRGEAILSNSIRTVIWNKLIINLVTGPVAVLTGSSPHYVYSGSGSQEQIYLAKELSKEIRMITTRLGLELSCPIEGFLAHLKVSRHLPSIALDLQQGKIEIMETQSIYGAPQLIAKYFNINLPHLDMIIGLVRLKMKMAIVERESNKNNKYTLTQPNTHSKL